MDGPAHDVCMKYYHKNSGDDFEKNLPKEYGIIEHVNVSAIGKYLFIQVTINRYKPTTDLHLQIAVHDNDLGILSHLVNTSNNHGAPIPAGIGKIRIDVKIRKNAGLKNGLVGVILMRGSGNIPGSAFEDFWGWDNGKQVTFKLSDSYDHNGYVGFPLTWHRCTSK